VVNICKAVRDTDNRQVGFEYRSDLHIMDLAAFRVTQTVARIDAGVYALGITDSGRRVAFVGRDQFAVLDLDTDKRHVVETYPHSVFVLPRQFSTLHFSKDGSKLVSLRNIYDIQTGTEQALKWAEDEAEKPRHISSVSVAPDLSYFAMVIPKRSLIMFGDDGLPHSYGKADKVVLLDTRTGKRTDLEITQSLTEGKRCVTDISPDSERVAVGCKGGLLRVYNARNGEMLWHAQNIGLKHDNGLMRVQNTATDRFLALLDSNLR
jgi:WD40 repeat protein